MNENIDLVEILKDCPKGFKLYSSICGTVTFEGIDYHNSNYPIRVKTPTTTITFSKKGLYFYCYGDSECCLFPSSEQRDWSKFTAPWYKNEQASSQTNEHIWLHLVSDVLTWRDGIGQYLDSPRVQEIAKRLCDKYAQKLYNLSVISSSSNTGKNEQKFDPKTLKPFDKVLVRDECCEKWRCDFYSHYDSIKINDSGSYPYVTINSNYGYCIPYNDETKYLAGTKDEAPKFYRYWED